MCEGDSTPESSIPEFEFTYKHVILMLLAISLGETT
jgi:hypothetical protein